MSVTLRNMTAILAMLFSASLAKGEDDFQKLEGTWQLVEMHTNGNTDTKRAKNYKWVFADGNYTILQNDKPAEVWKVRLSDRTIDSTHYVGPRTKGRTLTGIYELTDDTLRICYDLTAKGRPDKFETPPGSQRVLYILKRHSSNQDR